ncbi:MAG: hypothetical protein HOP09_04270 [Hyphomicrobium sp.]|nr:hypothetical protein [Hyphomicrobium sp.]
MAAHVTNALRGIFCHGSAETGHPQGYVPDPGESARLLPVQAIVAPEVRAVLNEHFMAEALFKRSLYSGTWLHWRARHSA